ncbi:phage holin family protein [Candidatus Saccharibacteria bacterium]|nr:phage holin family protein [Candidatus Saccharibacteria bacterium]
MIKQQILIFIFRWLISTSGMWLVINWFGQIDSGVTGGFWLYVVAGLVFSLVNSIVRPLATVLSLPLIIISMGFFTILINIAMMALTFLILPGVKIDFPGVVFGTVLMSVINGIMNLIVPVNEAK